MRQSFYAFLAMTGLALATTAHASPPKDPPTKCAPDAVLVGQACIDKYEASIWLVPPADLSGGSNNGLIKNIRKGKATLADLTAGNATQLGYSGAPFSHVAYPAEFPTNGNWVPDPAQPVPPSPGVYAASIPGVLPSTNVTWFQAEQACALSGKRLVTNQEWQRAAASTSDPGTDNGTSDCDVASASFALTGARTSCVSAWSANDMVGNVWEWVADWGDLSTGCTDWTTETGMVGGDISCVGGDGSVNTPGALIRGGSRSEASQAGVFAVASLRPSDRSLGVGLRCAR